MMDALIFMNSLIHAWMHVWMDVWMDVCAVMDYMEKGPSMLDLHEQQALSQEIAHRWFVQLVIGLEYCLCLAASLGASSRDQCTDNM